MYSVFLRTASIFYVLYPLCICQCSGTGSYFSFDQGWRKNIFIRPLIPYERLKLSDNSFEDNLSLNDYLCSHITVSSIMLYPYLPKGSFVLSHVSVLRPCCACDAPILSDNYAAMVYPFCKLTCLSYTFSFYLQVFWISIRARIKYAGTL